MVLEHHVQHPRRPPPPAPHEPAAAEPRRDLAPLPPRRRARDEHGPATHDPPRHLPRRRDRHQQSARPPLRRRRASRPHQRDSIPLLHHQHHRLPMLRPRATSPPQAIGRSQIRAPRARTTVVTPCASRCLRSCGTPCALCATMPGALLRRHAAASQRLDHDPRPQARGLVGSCVRNLF